MDFSKLLDALNKPKIALILAISSLVVLIFSNSEFFGFATYRQTYLPIVGVIFIVSGIAYLVYLGGWGWNEVKTRVKNENLRKKQIKYLENLTKEEQEILYEYVANNTMTCRQYFNNGIINGLVTKHILSNASQVDARTLFQEGYEYCDFNIHDWAWEHLNAHPELLSETEK